MAEYSITIPIGGYDDTNPTSPTTISVDRGFSRQVQHRVLTAKFGDGYEQRVKDGINTKNETFSANFNNRPASEINNIAKFFDNYSGKNFTLTVTDYDGDTDIKVVCDTYSIMYPQEEVHSLNATLRRVYEP